MSLYHGDKNLPSPPKELTRSWLYSSINRHDFFNKQHVVIASRECGDILFLKKFGVKNENIIACDKDTVALRRAKKLGVFTYAYPKVVNEVSTDIIATAKWAAYLYKANLASINVDLCVNLKTGLPILNEILALKLSKKTKVFFTFSRRSGRLGPVELRNDASRHAYLEQQTGKKWEIFPYISWTNNSHGAIMLSARMP